MLAGQNTTVPTLTLRRPSHSIVYVSGGSNAGDPAQVGTVGRPSAEPFVVRVLDPNGVGAGDASVTFTVERGNGSVAPGSVFTDAAGYARTVSTLRTRAGENLVVARTDLVTGQSVTFTATGVVDVPDHLDVEGDNQTGTVGQALPNPLVVTVRDRYENPVPGVGVAFAPCASCGTASPPSATTGADGRVATVWTLGTLVELTTGRQTLVARAAGAALQHTFHAVGRADTPATMTKVSGHGQTWHVRAPLPEPLVVSVRDGYGNPAFGWDVAWTSEDGGSFATASSPVGLDGLASTIATTGPRLGTQTFTAEAASMRVSFTATVTAHGVNHISPDRAFPGCPDLVLEIFGVGFEADAVVIWDVGGMDRPLMPTRVERHRIVMTLPADLFSTTRTVPVTVQQTPAGRCRPFDLVVASVLPDTGQRLCCDDATPVPCPASGTAFYGQDAQFGWDLRVTPAQRFQRTVPVVDQPVVFDRMTQLEWQGCVAGLSGADCSVGSAVEMSWEAAMGYCGALDWGGHTDWRLPSVMELSGIIDAGRSFPSIDLTAFPATPSAKFWSSSTDAGSASDAWHVHFAAGHISPDAKADRHYVRCVRRRL